MWPWVSHLTSLYLCFLLDKKKECLSVVDIHYAFCFPCTFWTLFLFWGNFSPKGDLPPTGGIQELASPASLTSRLRCKEMGMVNVLDKSPSQLGLEVPNLQSDAPTGCGCRRETRRRWCQVQSALGRGGGAWRGICLQGLPWWRPSTTMGAALGRTCQGNLGVAPAPLTPKPDVCGPPGQSARKPRALNKLVNYFLWIKGWLQLNTSLCCWDCHSVQMLMRTHSLVLLYWVLWCPSDPSPGCEKILILNVI